MTSIKRNGRNLFLVTCVQSLPGAEKTEIVPTPDEDLGAGPEVPPSEDADTIEAFRVLAGDEDTEHLKTLLRRIEEKMETDLAPVLLAPDSDKAHRAAS